MIEPSVKTAILKVLHEQLAGIGFEHAEILESQDHYGDPILRIVIVYKKVGAEVDPSPTFSLARYVKEAIRPLGEERFPHFQHRFPEDQDFKAA